MKITLDRPLCIHDIGHRPVQTDYVVPAFGEAQVTDCHFLVGEGRQQDSYQQMASLTVMPYGMRISITGRCRVFQIRPGFDEPIYSSEGEDNLVIRDVQHGDWFLLMTDGMCEALDVEDLMAIMNRPDWTAEHKRDALLDYTSENQDNHSAYLLHVRSVDEDINNEHEEAVELEIIAEENLIAEEESEAGEAISDDESFSETSEGLFFDRLARNILIGIIIAYLLALIIGFVLGSFGV